jgi:fibro-slime domain-containing protein
LSGAEGRTFYDDLHANCLGTVTPLRSGFFPLDEATGGRASKICNLWPYWTPGVSTTTCIAGAGYPIVAQWDPEAGWGDNDADPNGCPTIGTGGFVPSADGTGAALQGVPHNYYFTSETRYLFRYTTPFPISFRGSGDVWVYVNGRLAIDLGGTHETVAASTSIDESYELETNKIYELVVFHANRHPRESNYELTLPNLSRAQSDCTNICGDGVLTLGEECDDGDENQQDLYGGSPTARSDRSAATAGSTATRSAISA